MTPNPLSWSELTLRAFEKPPYDVDDPRGINRYLIDYAEATRHVAVREGAELVEVYRLFEASAARGGPPVQELLLDGIHPNDLAHRMIADALEEPVRRAVARRSAARR